MKLSIGAKEGFEWASAFEPSSLGPRAFLLTLWREEEGQDLIEYTLLMAFVALASAALFTGAGRSIKGIWSTTNSQLAAANSSAS